MNSKLLEDIYRFMVLIRKTEERVADLYPQQEIRCPTHLSIGQEAVAVGVCLALRQQDWVFSTHRCHAHYIAKSGSIKKMLAELYGKSTGCAKGKGGSMHLVHTETGMMGASAVVGGSIPIAVGSALASVMEGIDRVSVAFFGESAVEEGVFHESLNFAVLKRLPIIFVCENNLYATHSHLLARQPADNISERFTAYKVSSFRTDGNDVLSIYQRAVKAVECCRRGEGPVFLECRTYRWREHVGPNYDYNLGYRTKEELESWMQRCPIKLYEKLVLEKHWMTAKQLLEIQHGVDQEIAEALAFAKESPFPEPHEIMEDVG